MRIRTQTTITKQNNNNKRTTTSNQPNLGTLEKRTKRCEFERKEQSLNTTTTAKTTPKQTKPNKNKQRKTGIRKQIKTKYEFEHKQQ